MAERIKLGGLWENTSRDGVKYLTGKLTPTAKILIFKNNYKQEGDNQPTHIMYLTAVEQDPNQRQDSGANVGFFGEAQSAGDSAGVNEDPFETDPQPRFNANRSGAAPGRPTGTRPAPPNSPLNAATTNTRPAAGPPPNRRPAPAPSTDDPSDFDDPFA